MVFDQLNFEKREINKGDLLLAEPFVTDPSFRRSVVLISQKNENGFVGFILNKKIRNMRLSNVLENAPDFDTEIFYGGPVEQNRIHFVHQYGDLLEGSEQIAGNLYSGGNFERLNELINLGIVDLKCVRFFLGYAGWDKNQLPEELNENSWITTISTKYNIFTDEPFEMWRKVLKEMGGKYKMIANFPEDPRYN